MEPVSLPFILSTYEIADDQRILCDGFHESSKSGIIYRPNLGRLQIGMAVFSDFFHFVRQKHYHFTITIFNDNRQIIHAIDNRNRTVPYTLICKETAIAWNSSATFSCS